MYKHEYIAPTWITCTGVLSEGCLDKICHCCRYSRCCSVVVVLKIDLWSSLMVTVFSDKDVDQVSYPVTVNIE